MTTADFDSPVDFRVEFSSCFREPHRLPVEHDAGSLIHAKIFLMIKNSKKFNLIKNKDNVDFHDVISKRKRHDG